MIPDRHKPLEKTRKKLEKIGINRKYHTIGYLGEMVPRLVSRTMPMFSIITAMSGVPVYEHDQIDNEAEFRARIILFMYENGYMDKDFIKTWR